MKPHRYIKFLLAGIIIFVFVSFSPAQKTNTIDSLKNLLTTPLHDTTRVNILNDIGGYLIRKREYNQALGNLGNAQELAEKIKYKKGLSNVLHRIGVLYMNKNNFAEANAYYQKALQIKKEIGDKKGIADVISNMGIVFSDQGEYAEAIENYFTALKIREEIKDNQGTAISLISIANIYYLQNNFKMALDYYFQAVKIKDVLKFKYFVADVYSNIGMTYRQMKEYPKALEYFSSSMKIDEELDDQQGIAISKSNIGDVYVVKKDYVNALKLLTESRGIFEKIDDKKGIAEVSYELGKIYDSINEPSKAIECFTKQLVLSKEINSKVNIKTAYEGLSKIYRKTNNYPEAYRFYTLFKAMEDSIQKESGSKTIAELEAKYKTEKKEKEIQLLKKEQELKNTENEKQKQLILGSISLLIILAVVGLLLYNRNQLKRKNILEKKNFELERNALANQMNPHFIFNSLGSISGFVAENEKDKAIEYLGVFSKLIRHNLEQSREELISVKQEADMLRQYLHLQQLRFDNKFNFEIKVNEKISDSLALPPMFIQPYVENAILHGVIPKTGAGNISVRFDLNENSELVCEVADDGIGILESKNRKSSFDNQQRSLAMTIAQERKEIINSKNKHKIQILVDDTKDGKTGTLVRLIFPLDYV